MSYPLPKNETKRLEALHRYGLLDTPPEQSFDDFAFLASHICGTPIGFVSLVDSDRQWLKAQVGGAPIEVPREQSFCSYAMLAGDVMIVEDATQDVRFSQNPLVTGKENIRFYAGAPLVDRDGYQLGALCAIGHEPQHLSEEQKTALEALARQVMVQMEYRQTSYELAQALADVKRLSGMLPICGHCKNIRDDEGYWKSVEDYISNHSAVGFSHGICPSCIQSQYPEMYQLLQAKGKM